jgi:hypothetical protein
MLEALNDFRQRTHLSGVQALPQNFPSLEDTPESGVLSPEAALGIYGPGQAFSYNHLRQIQRQLEFAKNQLERSRLPLPTGRATLTPEERRSLTQAQAQREQDRIALDRARRAVNGVFAVIEFDRPNGPNHSACRALDPALPTRQGMPSGLLAIPDSSPRSAPEITTPLQPVRTGIEIPRAAPVVRAQAEADWNFLTEENQRRSCRIEAFESSREQIEAIIDPVRNAYERGQRQEGANQEGLDFIQELNRSLQEEARPILARMSSPPSAAQIREFINWTEDFRPYVRAQSARESLSPQVRALGSNILGRLPDSSRIREQLRACLASPAETPVVRRAEETSLEREEISGLRCRPFPIRASELRRAFQAVRREAERAQARVTRDRSGTIPAQEARAIEQIRGESRGAWSRLVRALTQTTQPTVADLRNLRASLQSAREFIRRTGPEIIRSDGGIYDSMTEFERVLPEPGAITQHIRSCATPGGDGIQSEGRGRAGST